MGADGIVQRETDSTYARSSSAFLTLVAQGDGIGGGAYVVGVMKALKNMGMLPFIQRTIASSAGIPATVYPIMGKDRLAEQLWVEEVTKSAVVDIRRAVSNMPILDIDYLVDGILAEHPFDPDLFHRHPVEMQMSATRVDRTTQTLEHHLFSNRDPHAPLQMIKAGIAIPIVYGRTVVIEGAGEFIDGGIMRQISFEGDIQIITEPQNKTATTGGYGERFLMKRYETEDPLQQKIHDAAKARHGLYMAEYAVVMDKLLRYPSRVLIQPERHVPAGIIERDPRRVEATIKLGYDDTIKREAALTALVERRAA